jgi:hypothetical protein
MKRMVAALAVTLACTSVGLAQYKDLMGASPAPPPANAKSKMTVTGYLVDKTCVSRRASTLRTFGSSHPTDCARSAGHGLGVVSSGTWYPFDEKSAKKAAEVLKGSKTTAGLIVTVTGEMKGALFAVSAIKEIKP